MKSRKYVIKQQKTKGHYAGYSFFEYSLLSGIALEKYFVHRPMHNSASSYAANRRRHLL